MVDSDEIHANRGQGGAKINQKTCRVTCTMLEKSAHTICKTPSKIQRKVHSLGRPLIAIPCKIGILIYGPCHNPNQENRNMVWYHLE